MNSYIIILSLHYYTIKVFEIIAPNSLTVQYAVHKNVAFVYNNGYFGFSVIPSPVILFYYRNTTSKWFSVQFDL